MSIKHLRSKYKISNGWIAKKLGYSSTKNYNKSPRKKDIENLIESVYEKIKEGI